MAFGFGLSPQFDSTSGAATLEDISPSWESREDLILENTGPSWSDKDDLEFSK